MNHQHAVIWIDHREAHVLSFGITGVANEEIKSGHPHQHLHHKSGSTGGTHDGADHAFLEKVAGSLAGAHAILITGPANAKTELAEYIRQKHPALGKAIEGVVALDHPSEGELLKFARTYFKAADRMAT